MKISALPLPNGIVLRSNDRFSLCCLVDGQYFVLANGFPYQSNTYLKNLPVIRGFFYLFENLVYPSYYFSILKKQLHYQNKKTKKIDLNLINIFHLLITIFILALYFHIAYYILLFSNMFVFKILAFILALAFLFIIFAIWVGREQIKNWQINYFNILCFQKENKYPHISIDCDISFLLYVIIFPTFINGLLPKLMPNLFLNFLFSVITFFVLYGLIFEILYYAKQNQKNIISQVIYFPIFVIQSILTYPKKTSQAQNIIRHCLSGFLDSKCD